MSSISIETDGENKLTVEEYVRYIRIKELVQQFLDNTGIRDTIREYEEKVSGLSIELVIKYSVNKN